MGSCRCMGRAWVMVGLGLQVGEGVMGKGKFSHRGRSNLQVGLCVVLR